MRRKRGAAWRVLAATTAFVMLLGTVPVYADVPTKTAPSASRSAMPLPGTQEQEMANITFPAPYNTYEFVVTCMACHGGSVDQNVAHGSNWAGTNMASSARDPIFRANELIVNAAAPGAGNLCFRCHSPNGWMSGRFNPKLAGDPAGGDMLHSIVLSTDDEGIMCEACHRAVDNVKMDTVPGDPNGDQDPAFNLMSGVYDWPHTGAPYPQGPNPGDPFGDATLIYMDGMTYGGPRAGSVDVTLGVTPETGTSFTGQGYAVYPAGWPDEGLMLPAFKRTQLGLPEFNPMGQKYAYGPDGALATHFEDPADVPRTPGGAKDYTAQAISIEHPTAKSDFVTSSEFCGSCHELTVPLGTGMPEQRTYTEWAYSDFGRDLSGDGVIGRTDDSLAVEMGDKRCQDCHMPKNKHEYSDDAPIALNPDPVLAGFFPYGKDRNPTGGTVTHKLAGANRYLPDMMSLLYPEVDLEVIGAETGKDVRIFPGMMSDRSSMWDRTKRNTDISLRESVSIDAAAPVEVEPGVYEVAVDVTNNTGHRVPSGYPDGRRLWVHLNVVDALGNSLFESGEYDPTNAELLDTRSNDTLITSADEAMVYEKITGSDADEDGEYVESPHLLNPVVVFDNRIPPKGFDKDKYLSGGVKFIEYTDEAGTGVTPVTDMDRFNSNVDELTYRFTAAPGMQLTAIAEMKYQTHSRPFMEMLKDDQPASSPRPEAGPSLYAPNYPLTPNYLSDNPALDFDNAKDMNGVKLKDNWGGIAYAAWMKTGKGAPHTVDIAKSDVSVAPAAPTLTVDNPAGDVVLGQTIGNPFALQLNWTDSPTADGYEIWMRYGVDEATASWDRYALVDGDTTSYLVESLNVGKTYGFKVVAYNSAGESSSAPVDGMTPTDLPLAPLSLKVVATTARTVTLAWQDISDNEDGFIIERQTVDAGGPVGPFEVVAAPTSAEVGGDTGGNGGVGWVDTTVSPSSTYNYRVASYNVAGTSTFTQPPVQAVTPGVPSPPGPLTATASTGRIDLSWGAATGQVEGYKVYRSTNPAVLGSQIATAAVTSYSDTALTPDAHYYYTVFSYNTASGPSDTGVTDDAIAYPATPGTLSAVPIAGPAVRLTWGNTSTTESNYVIERSIQGTGVWTTLSTRPADSTTYDDATVVGGTSYSYRVRATSPSGVSGWSNTANITVAGGLTAPSNLRISAALSGGTPQVTLRWNDNATTESGFTVQRALNTAFTEGLQSYNVAANSTQFLNSGMDRGKRYYYRIRAYRTTPAQTTAWVGPVSVVTP